MELSENPHVRTFLPLLREAVADRECFLVGGAIRDWLAGRDILDFDFATPEDPTEVSSKFSDSLGGKWFFLDENRRQVRIVAHLKSSRLTFDFAPFRAATLADDLALRDYTMNSMALSVAEEWCEANVLDFMHARQDLAAGLLRMTSEAVLRSDPLRALKGIRHCIEMDLQLEPETLQRITQAVSDLRHVAVERIRQEVLRIVGAPVNTSYGISLLGETGIGRFFWGEHFGSSASLLVRDQLRCFHFWKILEQIHPNILNILDKPVEDGLSRRALLQWVFLLGNLYPDCALETAQAWRFSRNALQRIEAVSCLNEAVWEDFQRAAGNRRALLLWAHQYGPDPVDLLLGLAFRLNHDPAVAVEKILGPVSLLLEQDADFQVADLVDGHFLKRECGLDDGKAIGSILSALRRAEAYGEIGSRAEAEQLALALCHKKD